MDIIPAIDIINGQCVRLTQGDYQQKKIYDQNPVEVAQRFEAAGIKHLHVVDLDGARSQQIINHKILENIVKQTTLKVDFGGGIKSEDDVKIAFDCGAHQITIGTLAVKNKSLFLRWLEKYGPDKIILGADAKDEKIAINGWQQASDLHLFDFLEDYQNHGITHTICTDISKDGLLKGPATALYQRIREKFPNLKLIASGGITTIDDLNDLATIGCHGAIIGKAFYEGTIDLSQLKDYKKQNTQ